MSRRVKEWIAKHDDQAVPPRVRLRVFDAKSGKCHKCGRKVHAGEPWTCEHLIALINGGQNRESNLDVTCCNCLPEKNAADVAEKSKVADIRKKHLGIASKGRGFQTNRNGKFKRHMDGRVSLR